MKAAIKCEAVGDDTDQMCRFYKNMTNDLLPGIGNVIFEKPYKSNWVAEITGIDPIYKFKRSFLTGKKDYSEANSSGSRGVYVWYTLESGKIYEVFRPTSWKSRERFFCTVNDETGKIITLEKEEVLEWLKKNSLE